MTTKILIAELNKMKLSALTPKKINKRLDNKKIAYLILKAFKKPRR